MNPAAAPCALPSALRRHAHGAAAALLVSLLLGALLLGAGALGTPARAADELTISVTADGLAPAKAAVAPGTVVRWRNDTPDTLVRVVSTSANWSYDSQLFPPGQTSSPVTMGGAGGYDFRATRSSLTGGVEGSTSDGSIVVREAAPSSAGPRPSPSRPTVGSTPPRPAASSAAPAAPPSAGSASPSASTSASATPGSTEAGGPAVGGLAGLLGASPSPGPGASFPAPEVVGAVPFAPTVGSTLAPGTAAPAPTPVAGALASQGGERALVLPAVIGVLLLAGVVGAVVRVLLAEPTS